MEDAKILQVGRYERRYFDVGELRVDGAKEKRLVGYAAVFNSLSEPMFEFREKISKGAFAESIKKDDIRALWNHDPNEILGRNKSGTLRLSEDDKGLWFEVSLPETQRAHDLAVSVKRGDVSQNSFGFQLEHERDQEFDREKSIRTLKRIKLFDISPVTFAAYPQTELSVRYSGLGVAIPKNVYHGKMTGEEFSAKIDDFLRSHKIKQMRQFFAERR